MKVRFELNIDEIVEVSQFPDSTDEIFKGEEARGKRLLFVDRITDERLVICCSEPITDTKEYATLNSFFLPRNSSIITEEDKADATHDEIMACVQEYCNKILEGMVHCQNEINIFIGNEFDKLKAEGLKTGSGISEKTLLSALGIVTRK